MVAAAYLTTAVLAYLVGAVPVGLLVGKLVKGVDVRRGGSGRTGATNVLRQLGWRAAVATLVADAAKGALGVVIGQAIMGTFGGEAPYYGSVLGGVAAIAGHNWPAYIGFRGGRGVAPTLGGALVLSPIAALLTLPVALALIVLSDKASVGSLFGTLLGLALFGISILLGYHTPIYGLFALVAGLLIVFQHRDNIQRLLRGEERTLGIRSKLHRAS